MPRPKKRKSKFHKKITKILVFLAVLVVSVVFLLGLSFYKTLTKSFASAGSAYTFNLLDRDIYSLTYITTDTSGEVTNIYVLFIDKNNQKLTLYKVPPNYPVDIPGKFGEEEIIKAFSLGKLVYPDKDGGINLLKASLSKVFGFEVSKYIVANSAISSELDSILLSGKVNVSADLGLLNKLDSNLKTDLDLSEFFDTYNSYMVFQPPKTY